MEENKFSYSKLDTYIQCPFKFYLSYIENIKVPAESIALEFGTLIHETEEAIANMIIAGEQINYIELKNKFILTMAELKHKYPIDYYTKDKSDRTYEDKAYYYLEYAIYNLEKYLADHQTYKIVGVEKDFSFLYKDTKQLHGFIDRIFYDTASDTYIIQDIKTYAIPMEQSKLTTPLQFVFYTLALRELFTITQNTTIKCQYYLPLCNITQDAGTAGYIERGEAKMASLFENIELGEFAPHQSPLCHYCQFCKTNPNATNESKYLCPYFSHWTKENKIFSKENEWQGLDNHNQILESYQAKINS